MEIIQIINDHWDVFNNQISKYHKLDIDFIEKYVDELNWKFISQNKSIEWNENFLKTYEERFNWYFLAQNNSIIWTPTLISTFKRRLNWDSLIMNSNLPISDEFLTKYPKVKYISRQNVFLTDEIINKFNLNLMDYKPLWVDTFFSEDSVDSFVQNQNILKFSKQFYEIICLPHIQSKGLKVIYETKFSNVQKYFFLEPKTLDIDGLIPPFEFISGGQPIEEHFAKTGEIELQISKNKEGPERIYEAIQTFIYSKGTNLLVSENLKNAILNLKLPPFEVYPVKLKAKKITINSSYFILQFENDLLHKNLLYKDLKFKKVWLYFDKPKIVSDFNIEIKDFHDLEKKRKEFSDLENYQDRDHLIFPENFPISSDFDLHTYSIIWGNSQQKKLLITEFAKKYLENQFPGQLEFQSAQLLNIKIDDKIYFDKSKLDMIKICEKEEAIFEKSSEEKFYTDKRDRILNYALKLENLVLPNDEFYKIQKDLSIILPERFKKFYRKERKEFSGYKILEINQFYIEESFLNSYPDTIKSLIFGENQLGDSIGLLLEKDSDNCLMATFYEFLHETGECSVLMSDKNE